MNTNDEKYIAVLLKPLRICANYKPALGQGGDEGTTIAGFKALYGADPLYHWIGLDSELMYAAHKAAGGMTSVYRQLGVGCERLFREIAADEFHLTKEQLAWGYDVKDSEGKIAHLALDARLDVEHIHDKERRRRFVKWLAAASRSLGVDTARRRQFRGAVFEIRQGYKSADAKRQNADLRSALRALNENYLFVVAVTSSQINQAVLRRYRNAQMVVLVGDLKGNPIEDTFAFYDQVFGYSIKGFFDRNSNTIRTEVEAILRQLLSPT